VVSGLSLQVGDRMPRAGQGEVGRLFPQGFQKRCIRHRMLPEREHSRASLNLYSLPTQYRQSHTCKRNALFNCTGAKAGKAFNPTCTLKVHLP